MMRNEVSEMHNRLNLIVQNPELGMIQTENFTSNWNDDGLSKWSSSSIVIDTCPYFPIIFI